MPKADGQLFQEEIDLARVKLSEFWALGGGRKCSSCGHHDYFIMPALVGNRSDSFSRADAHSRYPAVVVMCQRCGMMENYFCTFLGIDWVQPPDGKDQRTQGIGEANG